MELTNFLHMIKRHIQTFLSLYLGMPGLARQVGQNKRLTQKKVKKTILHKTTSVRGKKRSSFDVPCEEYPQKGRNNNSIEM